jgi:predicted  nucleic acid-binding Zn-ribbon protein
MLNQQPRSAEETLEELLDKVSKTREDLVSIERSLERLRADISASQKKDGVG